MKKLASTAAFLLAAASMTAAPLQAQSNDYDPAMYDMMLDCAALQILFANNAKDEAGKQDSIKMGASFLTSAQEMSGNDLSDLSTVISPRVTKISGWVSNDQAKARKLTKTCAYVLKIGKNYTQG
ncbi:MAG: hypothetical protein R3E18_09530 [Sphingomonadaceae bacterium]|nr:hypothetical protein [Sphingomonadaceae bacterium]